MSATFKARFLLFYCVEIISRGKSTFLVLVRNLELFGYTSVRTFPVEKLRKYCQ